MDAARKKERESRQAGRQSLVSGKSVQSQLLMLISGHSEAATLNLFFFHEAFCDISHRLGGITTFGVFSDAFPGLKMWDTFACATAIFLAIL
jgi:hypothetical protein